MKRTLSLILAVLMLAGLMTGTVFAASTVTETPIINVRTPLPGQNPNYSLFASHQGYDVYPYTAGDYRDGVAWRDVTANKYLKSSDVFVKDHVYQIYVIVQAWSDWEFAVDSKGDSTLNATVNGSKATVLNSDHRGIKDSKRTVKITYTFPACKNATVSAVSCDVTAPVTGELPVFAASTKDTEYRVKTDAKDTTNGVDWLDNADQKEISASTAFRYNRRYRVYVTLEAMPGYSFSVSGGSSSVGAKINGVSCTAVAVPGQDPSKVIEVNYLFPACESLKMKSASITDVVAPVGGQTPNSTFSPVQNGYHQAPSTYGKWTDASTGTDLSDSDKFVEGKIYRFTATLAAAEGFEFVSGSTEAYVNGKKGSLNVSSAGRAVVTGNFTASSSPVISSVAVTGITAPFAGAFPVYTASVSSSAKYEIDTSMDSSQYHIKNGVQWLKGGTPVDPSSTFTGGYYSVLVFLKPKAGFTFENDGFSVLATGTLNGKEAVLSTDFVSDGVMLTYDFEMIPLMRVITAAATVTEPAAGAAAQFKAVPGAKQYYVSDHSSGSFINGVAWYDNTAEAYLKSGDKFVAGHQYRVHVRLTAMDGCFFSTSDGYNTDVGGLMNMKPCSAEGVGQGSDVNIVLVYDFDALPAPVKTVSSVTLTGAVSAGTVLDSNVFKTSTDGVSSVNVVWSLDGKDLPAGTKASNGRYTGYVTLNAADGYVFNNDTKVTAFSKEANVYSVSSDGKAATAWTASVEVKCDHKNSGSSWSHDDASHWKVCSVCGQKTDNAAHSFGSGVANAGSTVYTCSVCGYKKTVTDSNAALKVSLPDLTFPKTYGDVFKETSVTYAGGKPQKITFSLKSGSTVDTAVLIPSTGKWQSASGGSADAVLNKKIQPFAQYEMTVEIALASAIKQSDVAVTDPSGAALKYSVSLNGSKTAVVTAGYSTSGNYVSFIDIEGVKAPVMGAAPSGDFKVANEKGISPVSMTWNATGKFVCGNSYSAVIKVKLDNGWQYAAELKATVNDSSEGIKLSVSGDVATVTRTWKAVGHTFGEWTAVKAATVTETGLRQRVCSACGHKESEIIPVLAPNHVHSFRSAADELNHWTECDCGEKTQAQPHVFEDGICAVCGYTKSEDPAISSSAPASETPSSGVGSTADPSSAAPASTHPQEEPAPNNTLVIILALVALALIGAGLAFWFIRKKKQG